MSAGGRLKGDRRLRWEGTPQEVAPAAIAYLRALSSSALSCSLASACSSVTRGIAMDPDLFLQETSRMGLLRGLSTAPRSLLRTHTACSICRMHHMADDVWQICCLPAHD